MKDKEAILLADDSDKLSFGFERNFDEYVKQGIFSRVIRFNGSAGNWLKTPQEIENRIVEVYDDFFRKNNIDFSMLEAVYSSADIVHSLGAYLTLKGIHYYFYEGAQNHIKSHFPIGYPLGTAWVYADVMYKYGTYNANNPLVTPIFYPQSVNPFPPDKEVEYFNPDVSKIPDEDIEKLRVLWGFDPLAIPHKNKCLVVCSSEWEIKGVAIGRRHDEMMKNYIKGGDIPLLYRLMIQLSLDYFLREGFTPVIKWHPIIEIPDVEVNLPDAIPVNRLIDMSFFDFLIKKHNISFEQFLSYGSTAVTKSSEIEDKNHLRLLAFVHSFHLANRIFAILKMIEKLAAPTIKIVFIDQTWRWCYADAINILANVLFGIKAAIIPANKLSAQDEVIIVVDPVSTIKDGFYTEIAKRSEAVVFFPSVDVTTTPDGIYQNALNGAYMQRRVVKKLLEHSVLPADDEVFNIICTKQDCYTTLRDFQFSRVLKYAKAEISLKPLSQDVLATWRKKWTTWFNQRPRMKTRVSKVLVTGGGSGIGLAIVKRLLSAGCHVCIVDRNVEKLHKAQADIDSNRLSVLQWDVRDIAAIPAKLLEASSLLGGYFDGVVQSAGIYHHVFISNTDPAVWDDIMDINAKAPFFIMQKVCQYFQQNHIQGNICNVSSCLGDSVRDIPGPYAAASLLYTKFTRSFGKAFASQGIIVNGVAPGDVQTEMCPRGGARNLLKRSSTPEEIAESVIVLLSDAGGGGNHRGDGTGQLLRLALTQAEVVCQSRYPRRGWRRHSLVNNLKEVDYKSRCPHQGWHRCGDIHITRCVSTHITRCVGTHMTRCVGTHRVGVVS
jgi:NAD(P)-dependent dehydrogenase (short-subunit alcohol dehydrogenase family)